MDQIDGLEPEDQDERMEVSNHLSRDFQQSFERGERKSGFPRDVHPYLGKIEQCPESIEEPEEEVDGLILYQTNEKSGTLIGNASEEFLQAREIAENSREDGSMEHTDLSDQVDEDVPVKQSNAKASETELDGVYCTRPSCPSASLPSDTVASTSDETHAKNGGKTEVSTDRENYEGPGEDCKNGALTISSYQDNKDHLLQHNKIRPVAALPENSVDAKTPDHKFPLLPDDGGEKKLAQLEQPIKVEETKMEVVEEALPVYPDSSEVKHAKFLAYPVKSEKVVTKAEQLDYPLKEETLQSLPEDLSISMKPERVDRKPEVLQFAAFSDGVEVKPEFASYPDVSKLKSETKPEGLGFTAFPDTSAIKPEAKPDVLELAAYPDSSEVKPEAKPEDLEFTEIKSETKQELLEADSTVLTPKLEQADGLVDSSESLVERGQVKEERPSTPGKNPHTRHVLLILRLILVICVSGAHFTSDFVELFSHSQKT